MLRDIQDWLLTKMLEKFGHSDCTQEKQGSSIGCFHLVRNRNILYVQNRVDRQTRNILLSWLKIKCKIQTSQFRETHAKCSNDIIKFSADSQFRFTTCLLHRLIFLCSDQAKTFRDRTAQSFENNVNAHLFVIKFH